jgi:hypothetical protein
MSHARLHQAQRGKGADGARIQNCFQEMPPSIAVFYVPQYGTQFRDVRRRAFNPERAWVRNREEPFEIGPPTANRAPNVLVGLMPADAGLFGKTASQ